MKRTVSILFALFLAFGLCLVMALPVSAAVAVTAATGGGAISADTSAGAPGAAWTNLTAISIVEQIDGDILASQTDVTLILNVPTGFQYNDAQTPSINAAAGDITALTLTGITATKITVTFTTDGAAGGGLDSIIIGQTTAIQVQPTAGTPLAGGNIVRDAASTSNITGINGTNFGTLAEIHGAAEHLKVTGAAGTMTAGTTNQLTIRAYDQFDNLCDGAGGAPAYTGDHSITFSGPGVAPAGNIPTVTDKTAAPVNVGTATTITFAAGVSTAGGLLTAYKAEVTTVDADDGAIDSTGNAAWDLDLTVNVALIDHYDVSAVSSPQVTGVTFNVVIQAQDLYDNNITAGGDSAENINITFGLADGGATPTSTATVGGTVTVGMTMTVAQAGQSITFTGVVSIKAGTSNVFTVTPQVYGGGGFPSASGVGSLDLTPYLNWQGRATADIRLTSTDSLVNMRIPVGTLALDAQGDPLESIEINMLSTPPPPPGYVLVGHAYDCLPDGANFQPDMTLTFKYAEADVPDGVNELDLALAYWDGEQWVSLTTTVNAAANTATARVAHFTPFAILAYTGTPVFGTSDLAITPVEANIGEEVTISLLVANTGDRAGSYEVTLEIDNVAVATEVVNLVAGASEGVNFTTTEDVAGTYTISVGGLSGTLVVKAAPATFSLSNLSIQPAEVQAGEAVTITVSVANTGGTEGSYTLVLKIDEVEEANKIVTVAPGSNHDVTLTITKEKAGIYSVSVGGLSGSFKVTSTLSIWLIIGIVAAITVVVLVALMLGRGSRGSRGKRRA